MRERHDHKRFLIVDAGFEPLCSSTSVNKERVSKRDPLYQWLNLLPVTSWRGLLLGTRLLPKYKKTGRFFTSYRVNRSRKIQKRAEIRATGRYLMRRNP